MTTMLRRTLGALMLLLAGGPTLAQQAPITVTVGTIRSITDAPIYLADKKGWFREEGLDVKMTPFNSAAFMVPPMGTGQLDVGAGSPSAGFYNAVLRGIKLRIVADKASSPPGYGNTKLLVRKDHVDSGRYKGLKDLKGMKLAMSAPGVSNAAMMNTALTSVGLKYSDIETVNLSFPDHILAYRNKVVDAGATGEPSATTAVKQGFAVEILRDDQIDPGHQLAAILYSEAFAKRTDAANRFMRAYLRGVRFYNGALANGRLAGPNAAEVMAVLGEYTPFKDVAVLQAITPAGNHPDGRVSMTSLQKDLDFYASQGLIEGKVDLSQIVEMSFADAAVKALGGPHKR